MLVPLVFLILPVTVAFAVVTFVAWSAPPFTLRRMQNDVEQRAATYRAAGLVPSWERAWSNGRDVTAEPPATWPRVYADAAAGRWGAEIAARYWRAHEQAAELGG